MIMKSYYVYILASGKNGSLYIGVTNHLLRRVYEHKHKLVEGFANIHGIDKLVYFEETNDVIAAINREKQIKKWNRKWKLELIEGMNPKWLDLYFEYDGREFEAGFDPNSLGDSYLDSRFRGNDKL